jgi:hypothetical protein
MQRDHTHASADEKSANKHIRTPYSRPVLVEYGSVRELTRSLSEPGDDGNPGFPNGSTV